MNRQSFNVVLKEDGEAPAPTDPNASDSQQTHNDVTKAVSFNLEIDPEDVKNYDHQDAIMVYKPFKFFKQWGFNVKPPIPATAEHLDDGNVEITFQLKSLPKQRFYLPYKSGETPIAYEGPIENKTQIISKADFEDIKAAGFDRMQPGMMPSGMGGMDLGMGGQPGMGGM